MHFDIYWPISFKLALIMETTELYILIPVGWPSPPSKVTVVWTEKTPNKQTKKHKKHPSALISPQISESVWTKFCVMPKLVGFLKPMLYLLCIMTFQGRRPYLHDFVRYIFSIGLHLNAHEWISFTVGLKIDTAKLHFDESLNDLDLWWSQGYEKAWTRAIILMQSGLKFARTFWMADYEEKSCKCGKYGLSEHLLFLFLFFALSLSLSLSLSLPPPLSCSLSFSLSLFLSVSVSLLFNHCHPKTFFCWYLLLFCWQNEQLFGWCVWFVVFVCFIAFLKFFFKHCQYPF